MVKIAQHSASGSLNDVARFLADVDRFFVVERWRLQVEWCLGEGADEIEKCTAGELELTDSEFRELYKGIYQTVDGRFTLLSNGEALGELLAVDSSYWEVSGPSAFESHMLAKYGPYRPAHDV